MLMPATSPHPLSLACCSFWLAFAGSLAVSHSPTVSCSLSHTPAGCSRPLSLTPLSLTLCLSQPASMTYFRIQR
ncbi:uncharacterized protein F5147DRAFT_727121 [Suillus discolor]|uniref:Secreted protein n=1 Tax=Suillus discolor TaxID=1912936 RepID=A0A9P7ETZ6_9AGAM|nr:uncharacterized protein F5147DRAFT_727121 [Suillus discolor]KAG2088160.1 hypothetical protein F5147DRAFT_727121 [Suillus discolor]